VNEGEGGDGRNRSSITGKISSFPYFIYVVAIISI